MVARGYINVDAQAIDVKRERKNVIKPTAQIFVMVHILVLIPFHIALPYTFQWLGTYPPKCPFSWGIWTSSHTWFPGPTLVSPATGSSIGSAVLQGLPS